MKIETKYHGEVEFNEEEILHFNAGIPGFADEKKFVLLPLADTGLSILQSIKTPQVGFVVAIPFKFFPGYDFQLEESVIEQISLEKKEDVLVYTILTVQDPFENTTANLQAPIIINTRNNKAKQIVLNEVNYNTRHPIFAQRVKG